MKWILCLALALLTACSLTVADPRTELEIAATRTAIAQAPLPPLSELGGTLRVVLKRPPVDIAPAIAPPTATALPDWSYVVTPTPKASE
jgi:hypothetical protein